MSSLMTDKLYEEHFEDLLISVSKEKAFKLLNEYHSTPELKKHLEIDWVGGSLEKLLEEDFYWEVFHNSFFENNSILDSNELWDTIVQDVPDLDDELFESIQDEGIETSEQWEDAYVSNYPSSLEVEAEFTEQLLDDLGYLNEATTPNFIFNHINWQEVWDCELSYDYSTIEHDGTTYFFSKNF